MTINSLIQGLYDKAPLEQHFSPSVSELVTRLLITDPERRPSAKEVLDILTVQEESVFVTAPENKALSSSNKNLSQYTLLVTSGSASSENPGDNLNINETDNVLLTEMKNKNKKQSVRNSSPSEFRESTTNQQEPVSVNPTAQNALSKSNLDETDTLLVTSSGPTAEHQGGYIGVYREDGTYNNFPYYKQEDTERSDDKEFLIYRRRKGGWAIGTGLDETIIKLKNASETESVPLTGWTCNVGDGKFRNDPHLRISPDQPSACGEITITASGGAAAKQPECIGVYTLTPKLSAGRRVFKHQTQQRYLLVRPGYVQWGVSESVESDEGRMRSSCAPSMCPADQRALTSERFGWTSWQYKHLRLFASDKWKHGDITVKCSVHKY